MIFFCAINMAELKADIALVVSNHPDLEEVAERFRTPLLLHPQHQGQSFGSGGKNPRPL